MSKLEVLCPNGRRVLVKVAPNTKLLQVMHEFLGSGMRYCSTTELANEDEERPHRFSVSVHTHHSIL